MINNSAPSIGRLTIVAAILLTGCAGQYMPPEYSGELLPACSKENTPFADKDFANYSKADEKGPTYQWGELFDEKVQEVVDAHMRLLLPPEKKADPDAGGQNDSKSPVCTAATYREMIPASSKLSALANALPGFKNRRKQLSEVDMDAVLLEWLRVYQCSLKEEETFAQQHIQQESNDNDSPYDVEAELERRRSFIEYELSTSQQKISRLMTVLGGLNRLRPLTAELTCLERTSADIRNNISLLSEASACLPRALNAKTSLRDFTIEPK